MTTSRLPKGIRRKPNGSFLVDVFHAGKRKTRTVATLEEAVRVQVELTMELRGPVPTDHTSNRKGIFEDGWMFQTALEKTKALVWQDKPGTRAQVLNAKAAVAFFGERTKLSSITLEDVDGYVAHLQRRGDAGSTINRKLSALSSMLRVAWERGKIDHLIKMPRRKEGEHRIRFLSPDEEARLLHYVRDVLGQVSHAEAIMVLLYTGFRCGELWRLEARDVDLEHGTLTLWKTKNGHPRTIPIVSKVRPIIERRLAESTGGRLFPEGGNEWIRRVWDRARLDLGYAEDTQFVPHMLRHTCATRLAQKGISMPVIKEWMGHTTIQTTARYAHFSPKDLRNAAALLGD